MCWNTLHHSFELNSDREFLVDTIIQICSPESASLIDWPWEICMQFDNAILILFYSGIFRHYIDNALG